MLTLLGMSASSGSGYDGFAPWIVYMSDEKNIYLGMKKSVRTAYADEIVVGALCLTALTAAGKRERAEEYMELEPRKKNS